jgi:8-oxo-dGTP pyrophosphatase MutT (NUDIX family)
MTEQPHSWIIELRARLESPPPRRRPPTEKGERGAAILVPLFVETGELWTLLTRRTEHLPTHKNQIAFPGGAIEAGEESWDAAVRETHEEVGLEPKSIVPIGALDEIVSVSGYRVTPWVGAVPSPVVPRIHTDEIAEAFQVPLTAISNPRLIEDRPVEIDGRERVLRIYHVGRRQIWGLTAAVLTNLLERLGMAPVVDE